MKNIKVWKSSGMPAIREERAIKGIASGVFFDNLWPKYLRAGEVLSKDRKDKGDLNRGGHPSYIYAESVTNFMILVGVFFPSATGIMAGSNRSGNFLAISTSNSFWMFHVNCWSRNAIIDRSTETSSSNCCR